MPEDDVLTAVRVQLGRLEGMLERALTDHGNQLQRHESTIGGLGQKTSSIDSELSGHKELIHGVSRGLESVKLTHTQDIADIRASQKAQFTELKTNQTGQFAKIMMVVTPFIAILAFIFSISKDMYGG